VFVFILHKLTPEVNITQKRISMSLQNSFCIVPHIHDRHTIFILINNIRVTITTIISILVITHSNRNNRLDTLTEYYTECIYRY
jgi:hypothetical protein